jgi:peptidoglycan/LPS O-acetylase OafA/YrhL
MPSYIKPLICLVAGLILVYQYWRRKKGCDRLQADMLPSLTYAEFNDLKELMRQSAERTLFLSLAFVLLAAILWTGWHEDFQIFAIVAVVISVGLNIGPRHRLAKMIFNTGIDTKALRKKGIRF